jgi:DNA modification methylase
MIDIFGEKEQKNLLLRDKYIEPPFSVLDTKTGAWQRRRKMWKNLGVNSETGIQKKEVGKSNNSFKNCGISGTIDIASEAVFDPVLCEIMYNWFCEKGGSIIDTFTGTSVSGIVASILGFKFTGIDIREEIVKANYNQANKVLSKDNIPNWLIGDSNVVLDSLELEEFDLYYSCPPYADLVVYSDLDGDISNKKYEEFIILYRSIIKKACNLLVSGGYAIFTIGEVRNKKTGGYYGFLPDTVKAFTDIGMIYYNEVTLLNSLGTAPLRVGNTFERGDGKLVKVHQNVLIFRKP